MRTLSLDPYATFNVLRDAGWEREFLIDWYRLVGVDVYTDPVLEWSASATSAPAVHRRACSEAWIPEDEDEAVELLNHQAFAGLLPADQPYDRPFATKHGICWVDRVAASPLLRSEFLPDLPERFVGSAHLIAARPRLLARLAAKQYRAVVVVLHPTWVSSVVRRLDCRFRVERRSRGTVEVIDDVDRYLDRRPKPLRLFYPRKPC